MQWSGVLVVQNEVTCSDTWSRDLSPHIRDTRNRRHYICPSNPLPRYTSYPPYPLPILPTQPLPATHLTLSATTCYQSYLPSHYLPPISFNWSDAAQITSLSPLLAGTRVARTDNKWCVSLSSLIHIKKKKNRSDLIVHKHIDRKYFTICLYLL